MFRIIAVVAAAGALTLGATLGAAPAFADNAPKPTAHSSLTQIQQAGAIQTANRITALNNAITRVNSNTTLTASDRGTILGTLNTDVAAMTSLQAKIAADTTVSTAWTDYRSIFTQYRVYAVVLPQSYEAAAADGLTDTAIPKLQSAHDKLAANLAADPSKWSSAMQSQLSDMQAKIDDAKTRSDGLAARALAVTAAGYNADHTLIANIRTDLRTAVSDARAAGQDGKALVQALQ